MADKELNLWIERFSREIGYKSSVIVFGNTADIMLNPKDSGKYDSVINTLISHVRDKGFAQVIKWDRVGGIDHDISDEIIMEDSNESPAEKGEEIDKYDLDIPDSNKESQNNYKSPDEFFETVSSFV